MVALITGATGHLGPHLVAALLRTTAFDRIYVVARGGTDPAIARVRAIEQIARAMLASRGITGQSDAVVPIEADLAVVGRSGASRAMQDVRVVVHAAADTRFTAPYEHLHRANVDATRAMCRFAEDCPRLQQFLFVSTACVAGRRRGSIAEQPHHDAAGFANAYEQTKWEAEGIVIDSGLPARIARLTTCAGSHEDGYVHRLGALHHLLRWMARGLVPMIPGSESTPVDVISTDVAAAWLARAALQPPYALDICHVALGRHAMPLGRVLDTLLERLNEDKPRLTTRPLLVSEDTFAAFTDMVRLSGDALFARVQASAAAVLPSLLYPKVYATDNAERCWKGPLPHAPWPILLQRVLSFCRAKNWDLTSATESAHV
jgi:nucleoside-diphosphate-sugar epimerase